MSNKKIKFHIDDQLVEVDRGITILEAARQYDIYIPTLCEHKDLTPFGGCRMCIVKVEGRRGLTTACTTPAADGIKVYTNRRLIIDLQDLPAWFEVFER